jgi:hypothetical protein
MRTPGVQAAALARQITLDVFATDESASVQATLYKMAQRLLTENAHIARVTYRLPNKHYIPVDMRYIGIDNLTPCVSGLPDRVDGAVLAGMMQRSLVVRLQSLFCRDMLVFSIC